MQLHLEITPSPAHSLKRLAKTIHDAARYNTAFCLHVITPNKFKDEVLSLIGQNSWNILVKVNQDQNCLPSRKEVPYNNIYYQFDYLDGMTIDQNDIYISSLRFPRSMQNILDWQNGKRADIILSLLAISDNVVTTFNPKSNSYITIGSERNNVVTQRVIDEAKHLHLYPKKAKSKRLPSMDEEEEMVW